MRRRRTYNIGLPEDDQHPLSALLQTQPSAGTQKKLHQVPIKTSGDTLQHTRSQGRRTPLPQTTILSQWLPELIRLEVSAKTDNRQYYNKTQHMASNPIYRQHLRSSRPSSQTTRNRNCPSTSKILAQPPNENQRSNRPEWTVVGHLQSPVQGLFQ